MSAMADRQTVSRWEESETPPRTQPEIGDDGCRLGWAGWGGGLSHPSSLWPICTPAPASHPSTVGDREDSSGCFVFSPLCRGVSHQLALNRPGRKIARPEETEASGGEDFEIFT